MIVCRLANLESIKMLQMVYDAVRAPAVAHLLPVVLMRLADAQLCAFSFQ